MTAKSDTPISPIEDIIEDARNGRPYILVDAEDRENEGDVIIPAQMATPEQIKRASELLAQPYMTPYFLQMTEYLGDQSSFIEASAKT